VGEHLKNCLRIFLTDQHLEELDVVEEEEEVVVVVVVGVN